MKTSPQARAARQLPLSFDLGHARLIQARAKLMDRDIAMGETLCRYSFIEGAAVSTIAIDGAHVRYNRAYAEQAAIEELTSALRAMAIRSHSHHAASGEA